MTDPTAAAWHALRRSAAASGIGLRLVGERAIPWWSATFAGHRLTLTLAAPPGGALDAWLAALPEADLPIVDRIVADCAIDRVEATADAVRVRLALLLLDVE